MKVLGVILLFFGIYNLMVDGIAFSMSLIIELLLILAGISCFLYREKR